MDNNDHKPSALTSIIAHDESLCTSLTLKLSCSCISPKICKNESLTSLETHKSISGNDPKQKSIFRSWQLWVWQLFVYDCLPSFFHSNRCNISAFCWCSAATRSACGPRIGCANKDSIHAYSHSGSVRLPIVAHSCLCKQPFSSDLFTQRLCLHTAGCANKELCLAYFHSGSVNNDTQPAYLYRRLCEQGTIPNLLTQRLCE